jgi:hypothetical protein
MGYIGNRPTAVPLTSADIQDGVITAADLGANSVDSSELVDNSVTLAKMAGLARGKLIYGDASGDPAALAVGGADEVLTHDGTDFDWAAASAGGITAASQWRLTTSFTGAATPIASNLEEVDTDGYGSLGSAMTESSGIFTFPSTGYWLIEFTCEWGYSGDSRYNSAIIQTTTDDSSYGYAALSQGGIAQVESSSTHANAKASFIFDVTSTSTHKVRFSVDQSSASVTVSGNTGYSLTHMTFIRLGDT